MPRRNQRDPLPPALDLTATQIPKPRRPVTETAVERRAREADYKRKQHASARRARVAAAISWTKCCIPGCEEPYKTSNPHDVDLYLPVCTHHAVIVKRQIDPVWQDHDVIEARLARQAMVEQREDGYQRASIIATNDGATMGQIYFLRANGLIKVGWSSDLIGRLKHYGPEVDVLCHYPASRQDETLMHRQLRPYLARGREWYQDCKLITDVVAGIVKRHGEPHLAANWTEPKAPVVKMHKRGA